MIQEVERELETYERETGREVTSMPQTQGLTGFTLSLVSSIRRLVSYLKEVRGADDWAAMGACNYGWRR